MKLCRYIFSTYESDMNFFLITRTCRNFGNENKWKKCYKNMSFNGLDIKGGCLQKNMVLKK